MVPGLLRARRRLRPRRALQTKAEDKGDHFIINGQKIWTSGAQCADWCFCLVRTDTSKKHEGISFVLFTMHQPGVEVRPIQLIAGVLAVLRDLLHRRAAEKKDLVGPLNGGWTIAKRLLQHERSGLTGAGGGGCGTGGRPLEAAGQGLCRRRRRRAASPTPTCARALVTNAIEMRAFQQTAVRAMAGGQGQLRAPPPPPRS